MSSMMPPSGGQEQMLRSPTNTNPFPNMARNRDQMDMLWRHIASVLSNGIRERAMAGEQPAEGLTPIRDEKRNQASAVSQGSWERAMGEQLTPLPAEELTRGMPDMPEQLGDPGAGREGRMSAEDIAQTLVDAGFRGESVPIMVAIALAESSGNPRAHNPDETTGDNSYGLFQINMLDTPDMMMGQERRERYGLSSNEELWDPDVNARVAYDFVQRKIASGRNPYEDWSVYRKGLHMRYWDVASEAAAAVQSGGGS